VNPPFPIWIRLEKRYSIYLPVVPVSYYTACAAGLDFEQKISWYHLKKSIKEKYSFGNNFLFELTEKNQPAVGNKHKKATFAILHWGFIICRQGNLTSWLSLIVSP
jgi:hypothetical protein